MIIKALIFLKKQLEEITYQLNGIIIIILGYDKRIQGESKAIIETFDPRWKNRRWTWLTGRRKWSQTYNSMSLHLLTSIVSICRLFYFKLSIVVQLLNFVSIQFGNSLKVLFFFFWLKKLIMHEPSGLTQRVMTHKDKVLLSATVSPDV